MPKKRASIVEETRPIAWNEKVFSRERLSYTQAALSDTDTWSDKELLSEYRKLYKTAQSRLDSLSKSEWADTRSVRKWIHDVKPAPKEIVKIPEEAKRRKELEKSMYDTVQFLRNKTASVRGMNEYRDAQIRSMRRDKNLAFVNRENYRSFVEFLDTYRETIRSKQVYKTVTLADYYDRIEKSGYQPNKVAEAFLKFLEDKASGGGNEEKLKKFQERHKGRTHVVYGYKQYLTKMQEFLRDYDLNEDGIYKKRKSK